MLDPTLLEHVRTHLVEEGVNVRDPRVAGEEHPLWLEPKGGAKAPGEAEKVEEDDGDLVASAFRLPGITTGVWEGDTYRFDNVELRLRCHRPPDAYDLEEEIRPLLHDRRDFDLAGLRVIEAMIFAELSPIGNSSEQGFTFRIEYSIQRYV